MKQNSIISNSHQQQRITCCTLRATLPNMVVNPMISTLGSLNAIRIAMLSSRNRIVERTDSENSILIPYNLNAFWEQDLQ